MSRQPLYAEALDNRGWFSLMSSALAHRKDVGNGFLSYNLHDRRLFTVAPTSTGGWRWECDVILGPMLHAELHAHIEQCCQRDLDATIAAAVAQP